MHADTDVRGEAAGGGKASAGPTEGDKAERTHSGPLQLLQHLGSAVSVVRSPREVMRVERVGEQLLVNHSHGCAVKQA